MRKRLAEINGKRLRFRATVGEFGLKNYTDHNGIDHIDNTVVFKNVCRVDTGEEMCDHLWFTVGSTIETLKLEIGDAVEFDARVDTYQKGYVNHRKGINNRKTDYKLTRPTKFLKLAPQSIEPGAS